MQKIFDDTTFYPNIEFSQEESLKKIVKSIENIEKTENKKNIIKEIDIIDEELKKFINQYPYFKRDYEGFIKILENTKKKIE